MKPPKRKKVIVEFKVEVLERIRATHNNRSNFIRHAVAVYLAGLERKKRDLGLAEAYRLTAENDRRIAEEKW